MSLKIAEHLWLHRWHILLLPVLGLTLITFLHEAMHAVAVMAQGGEVLSFQFLPSKENYGLVEYRFSHSEYDSFLISAAPYYLWSILALIAAIISIICKNIKFALSSTLFVWFFSIPIGDIFVTALPYSLYSEQNDFLEAFGPPSSIHHLVIWTSLVAVLFISFVVHKNYYHSEALPFAPYSFLYALATGLVTFP